MQRVERNTLFLPSDVYCIISPWRGWYHPPTVPSYHANQLEMELELEHGRREPGLLLRHPEDLAGR
jgi:hypothetical protein